MLREFYSRKRFPSVPEKPSCRHTGCRFRKGGRILPRPRPLRREWGPGWRLGHFYCLKNQSRPGGSCVPAAGGGEEEGRRLPGASSQGLLPVALEGRQPPSPRTSSQHLAPSLCLSTLPWVTVFAGRSYTSRSCPRDRCDLVVLGPGLQVLQSKERRVVQAEWVLLRRLPQALPKGLLLEVQHQPVGPLTLRLALLCRLPPGEERQSPILG